MQIRHVKTYSLEGEIEITDFYDVLIISESRLNQYLKEEYDNEITLEELIQEEMETLDPHKVYFNNSVKFRYKNSYYDDDFTNNVKDLLKEKLEINLKV
jgi:hypothetical protein